MTRQHQRIWLAFKVSRYFMATDRVRRKALVALGYKRVLVEVCLVAR